MIVRFVQSCVRMEMLDVACAEGASIFLVWLMHTKIWQPAHVAEGLTDTFATDAGTDVL